MKKHIFPFFFITLALASCSGVYPSETPNHNYETKWSNDETSHWHACTDEGFESLKADEASHTFNSVVTDPTYESGGYTTHTCTVCGYTYTDSQTNKLVRDYEYVAYKDGIKLIKCNLEYSPVIEIPTVFEEQKVVAIGAGCFKQEAVAHSLRRVAASEEEYTTYFVSSEIEEIEEGSFSEGSTFVTDSEVKNEGWLDSSMTGSATSNEGNVYYSTERNGVVHKNGCVYIKSKTFDDYFFARCLSKQKTIDILPEIEGKKVVYVGEKSFYKNRHVEVVNFPYTIGTIYTYAFKGCTALRELNFNSPNLSIIKPDAFSQCESLDVVHLPEKITKISSQVFSSCGTISKIYIPATIISFADDAFYNTVVEKIIFAGSEEKWNMVMNLCNCTAVSQIPVECQDESGTIELSSVNELELVADGKTIKVRGVLCGYSRYRVNKYSNEYQHEFAMIKDKDSNFCVIGYNGFAYELAMTYDVSWIGREVECTGDKGYFNGSLQITNIHFELTEDETIYDIAPSEFDWGNEEFVPSEHVGEYIHYEGTYLSTTSGGITRISGFNYNVIYFETSYPTLLRNVKANDRVSFNLWIMVYNQTWQAVPDLNTLQIITNP